MLKDALSVETKDLTTSTVKKEIDLNHVQDGDLIHSFKVVPKLDSRGIIWTEGSQNRSPKDEGVITYVGEDSLVFSPALNPYNLCIALQERTLRLTSMKLHVKNWKPIEKIVFNILSMIEVSDNTISSLTWIEQHRIPSGKKGDLPVYKKFMQYHHHNNMQAYDASFDRYVYHNDEPKLVSTRMKLHEKFEEEAIKPRLYDVLDPIHAIIAGPIYFQLAQDCSSVPGY